MARGLNRLSAKAVETTKRPGLVADGGSLYLQVSRVSNPLSTKNSTPPSPISTMTTPLERRSQRRLSGTVDAGSLVI
jgi:hypothetical protein